MLPDFPRSRKELSEKLLLYVRMGVQRRSVFAELGRQYVQHEGTAFSFEQIMDEKRRQVRQGYEQFRSPVRFTLEEIPDLAGDRLFQKLDELAEDMARQTSELGFRRLDESSQLAGTATDADGSPLTKDLFLQAEDKADWDFDPKTGKREGIYIAHPDTAEAMHNAWIAWEKDKEFMKRVEEMRARKYEEWRDRESNRKLVD